MRWLSHIFIAALVFTKLLLDEIYHLIELLFDWCDIDFCLLVCWIAFRHCYSYLTWETGRLELAPTIILVSQAKRLTKCARSFESRNTSIQKECCVIYIFHSTILIFNVATAWKVSKDGVFSGPYFTVFSPKTGKCGTEKTPYLDTFFTKLVSLFQFALIIICDFCTIWYHLNNSKNVKNTPWRGVKSLQLY